MAYEKMAVAITGQVLGVTLVKPSQRDIDRVREHNEFRDENTKPWKVPTDKWVVDFLYKCNGINEIKHFDFPTQPKLEPGKQYVATVTIQGPTLYVNVDGMAQV